MVQYIDKLIIMTISYSCVAAVSLVIDLLRFKFLASVERIAAN